MSLNATIAPFVWPTITTSLNGVTAGSVVPCNGISNSQRDNTFRGLSFGLTLALTTASLAITTKVQVSADGVTWHDTSVAPVLAATGTGAPVTTRAVVGIEAAFASWRFIRVALTTSGATAALADTFAGSWTIVRGNWLEK